jgi:hypothetical protein
MSSSVQKVETEVHEHKATAQRLASVHTMSVKTVRRYTISPYRFYTLQNRINTTLSVRSYTGQDCL